jgi:hypothetical protein
VSLALAANRRVGDYIRVLLRQVRDLKRENQALRAELEKLKAATKVRTT